MAEMMVALGDLANLFVQARRFQVDALNQERFSQAEYSWVRDRIFQAAGVHVTSTIDLRKLEARGVVRGGTAIASAPSYSSRLGDPDMRRTP